MPETMKRLILTAKGGPWEMQEVPVPVPGPGEALIRVLSTTACNQTDLNAIKALHPPHEMQSRGLLPHDLRIWDNRLSDDPLQKYYNRRPLSVPPYPTTMGHEAMGVVEALGPMRQNRSGIRVGDRVALGGSESTFAQYTLCPESLLAKVPDDMTDDEAALLEPWSILWSTCQSVIQYGDVVCILGQGALGLFATQWARIFGAKTIITTDPLPMKRELSLAFGADVALDPATQNITQEVMRLTGGVGCRVAFDCAGVPDTLQNLPYLTCFDGVLVQIGACCEPVLVDWGYIHFKGLKVHSATSAGLELRTARGFNFARQAMLDAAAEKAKGRLHLQEMITHHPAFSVEGVTALFKEIDERGTVVKAAFHPWE